MRRVTAHVLSSTIVLDELRLVYVPVPKAGSTALLWALAPLAGLGREDFLGSRKLEVTRALTVHDTSVWGDEHLLENRSAREQEQVLTAPGWFRFTVVRDPVRRLWSAWTEKVLCRNPRFVKLYGSEEWFPGPPGSSGDVVEAFRQFVHALPGRGDDWHDPHWSSQAALISEGVVEYGHVGRTERLDETVALLRDHVGARGHALPPLERENATLLSYDLGLLDGPAAEACARLTARDAHAFGYEPPAPGFEPGTAWHAAVEAALPALRAVIERNERIADLRALVRAQGLTPPRSLAS
jgi:hypothetical protein